MTETGKEDTVSILDEDELVCRATKISSPDARSYLDSPADSPLADRKIIHEFEMTVRNIF